MKRRFIESRELCKEIDLLMHESQELKDED